MYCSFGYGRSGHGYGSSIVASIVASSGVPFSMVGTGFHSFTFPPVVVWKRGSGPALGLTADSPQSYRAIARADHSSACIALEATPAGALLLNKSIESKDQTNFIRVATGINHAALRSQNNCDFFEHHLCIFFM